MKKQVPITAKIGLHCHILSEPFPDKPFEHAELVGTWCVLGADDRFVLYRDTGRHVTFLEFYPHAIDNFVYYKGREWERHPRDDNTYILTKHKRFYGNR